jgi:lipopolysaccharide/colanic/teichoic acid biosynthesis glycosyltransferase
LRDNLEVSPIRLANSIPYLISTTASAAIVFLGLGLNRTIWRFSTRPDYVRIIVASLAVVVVATSTAFVYNRLDGVARSLPFLQFVMCQAFLIGARVLHKIIHDARQNRRTSAVFLQMADKEPQSTVLIVGISKLVEVYLQAITELAPGRIKVAGLVGKTDRHVGRIVATHPVLGVPEDIEAILDGLEVHGVTIDRIVIASTFHALAASEREALLWVERLRGISLQFLAEDLLLGGDAPKAGVANAPPAQFAEQSFAIDPNELKMIAQRRYWTFKRLIDCLGALALLLICSPLMAIATVLVAASVGSPVLFWQQRPGLGGRPFRLYKFRTMRAGHASDGRRLSDKERVSQIGSLMRRLRLDELPQLFNILLGDMCFIGPRPLLPCDQSDAYRARLLVRPGLTGWAQVIGGRDISPEDKAALDVWYVRNASMALDLEIAARTIPIVVLGERISRPLIDRAWRDLSEGGVLKGELAYKVGRNLPLHSSPA